MNRKIVVAVFALMFMLTTILGIQIIMPVRAETVTGIAGDLELRMTVENTTLVIGKELHINLTVRNIGNETVTTTLTSSQVFDIFAQNEFGQYYRWSYGKLFLTVVWDLILNPGDTYTEVLSWNLYEYDPDSREYVPPPPGPRQIIGYSLAGVGAGPMSIKLIAPGDFDEDFDVDYWDTIYYVDAYIEYGRTHAIAPWMERCDLNHDGVIDFWDTIAYVDTYIDNNS